MNETVAGRPLSGYRVGSDVPPSGDHDGTAIIFFARQDCGRRRRRHATRNLSHLPPPRFCSSHCVLVSVLQFNCRLEIAGYQERRNFTAAVAHIDNRIRVRPANNPRKIGAEEKDIGTKKFNVIRQISRLGTDFPNDARFDVDRLLSHTTRDAISFERFKQVAASVWRPTNTPTPRDS